MYTLSPAITRRFHAGAQALEAFLESNRSRVHHTTSPPTPTSS